MRIKEIQAKSIIIKSNLPEGDFVINPYVGCQHSCIYCYARFMKRFTGHEEPWGEFIDVKINAPNLIKNISKFRNKSITIGSVTDAYQPIELKYKLTKRILEKLVNLQPKLDIITKSDLVLRDIGILKKFDNCIIAFSFSSLDDGLRKQLEPLACSTERKINALRILKSAGIKTAVFISPIIPKITDWKKIIELTKDFTDEYWFENLNLYPSIKESMFRFYKKNGIEFSERDHSLAYWVSVEKEIREYCKNLDFTIYFHHTNIKRNKA